MKNASFLRRLLFAAATGLLLSTLTPLPAPAQIAPESPETSVPDAPQDRVEIEAVADDEAIRRRIENILTATGWFSDIRVTVDEGVVFLDGLTGSDDHRTWARNLAAKTAGAVAVVNRIAVREVPVWSLTPALAELEKFAQSTIAALPLILLAVLVLPLAWFAARLVSHFADWMLSDRIDSPFLRVVVARAIAFPVFLLGLYIVLQVAGLTQLALSLVGGAGVLGIVIGFAFRDIAENFLSSLILSVRRPFQRGDLITVAGITGTVQSMSTRSTLLSSVDGNHIHVPNSTIFKNVIENFTSSPNRRDEFMVGIGYDAQVAEAQDIILDCLQRHDTVLSEPEPMVLVDALGAATVNIRTYYWFDGHRISPPKLKSSLLRAVKSALTQKGISMPDEAREVIFPEGVRVIHADGDASTVQHPDEPPMLAPEPEATRAEGDLLSDAPQAGALDSDEDKSRDLLGSS